MDIKTKRYLVMGALALIGIIVMLGVLFGARYFMAEKTVQPAKSAPSRVPPAAATPTPGQQQDITLRTEDSVQIAATYYPGSGEGVILLHMLGSNRQVWDDFAKRLQQEGFAVIAIDLRGHGDSDLDWRDFTYPSGQTREEENDFLDMLLDVKAAKKYLAEQGKFASNIVGASLGANIAVLYAETDTKVKRLVLLSPGMSYRGVMLPSGPLYSGKALMIASSEDRPSADALNTYARRIRGEYKTIIYPGGAHGTDLLERQPELAGRMITWLKK